MTPTGRRVICSWEGLVLKVYLDRYQNPTAGWGHALSPAERATMPVGTPITREQAETWFEHDADWVDEAIDRHVTVKLNENQRAALESLVFNAGPGILTGKAPKLMFALNRGQFQTAANEFLDICHATDAKTGRQYKDRGLENRRRAEKQLFLTPVAAEPLDPEQVLFAVGLSLHDMVRAIDLSPHAHGSEPEPAA